MWGLRVSPPQSPGAASHNNIIMNGGAQTDRNGDQTRRQSFRRSPYAVLNLPHGFDAHHPINGDKIRESYKRLSRLLHPDKRPTGKERDDAQELFIEIQHACKWSQLDKLLDFSALLRTFHESFFFLDETLVDPVLRQAYDNFGHSAAEIIRHNRYAPQSLYLRLSKLHEDGKSIEALEVLHTVLEDRNQKQRLKEWLWNANVDVNMHASYSSPDGRMEGVDLSSTNVSLSASVPVITPSNADQPQQETATPNTQRLQLSIGGQSYIKNGKGSTQAMISANYNPVPHASITSDIAIGRNIESSISSSTTLANGTGLSAKVSRQILFHQQITDKGEGQLAFGITSNRRLTIFHGRIVDAMFALGFGSDLAVHYGILSLTTWGFASARNGDESERPPPQLNARLSIGTQYPISCSIDQSHLFTSPHRSGRVALAWSPLRGCKLKAMTFRKLFRKCNSQSKLAANLGIGVEHTGLMGFTWIIQYQRPEGLTVQIPIFVSSFLSPNYWNRALSVSLLSFVIDETIEESSSSSPIAKSHTSSIHNSVSAKISVNEKERQWLHSPEAKHAAERQLSLIAPVAREKQYREELANGLVILKATYSLVYSMPSEVCPNVSLDVTQQLMFWVNNSRLCLPPSSKCLLLGFYNLHSQHSEMSVFSPPRWKCMMIGWLAQLGFRERIRHHQCHDDLSAVVTLSVRYKYNGGVYDVTVKDDDALELPSSGALHLGSSKVVS